MTEKELILTHILGCRRIDLYSEDIDLTSEQSTAFWEIANLRKQGYPLQYLLGECEFMGLDFQVDERVLIPRPETEILVEAVIGRRHLPAGSPHGARLSVKPREAVGKAGITENRKQNILDVGTGSGCIAISLAKFLKNIEITAVDISAAALYVAKENAKKHKVNENIRFLQSDLFSHNFFKNGDRFDMIVANPPYVATSEIGVFDKTILHEPKIALDGGLDGLDFYRRIIKTAHPYLENDGLLFMEIGYNQGQPLRRLVKDSGYFELVEFIKDYAGFERIIVLRKT